MASYLNFSAHCDALRREMSLENLFALTCSHGDKTASLYLDNGADKTKTYADLARESQVTGAYFARAFRGGEGRYIGLSLDTCPEWLSLFWGLERAGYNAVLIDHSFSDDMTLYILRQAGAVGLVTRARRALPSDITQVTVQQAFSEPGRNDLPGRAFGTAVALCTSGTTDTSRVFVFSGEAVCHQVLNSELIYKANRRVIGDSVSRSLSFLPYHHVFGFMVCAIWMSFLGFESVYLRDRSPQTIIETATHFQITMLCAVPLLANNLSVSLGKKVSRQPLLKRLLFKSSRGFSLFLQTIAPSFGLRFARNVLFRDITSQLLGTKLDCVILGGSHTPRTHMRTLSALGYYTVSGFGMTETAVTSLETSMNVITRTTGSVGRPFQSAEYRVQSDGKRSNRGEMFIRGKAMHTSRLKDGQLLPPDVDENGWYATGDVVRLEKGSRMYVEGRTKDVIINESGENVYPDEIEDSFGDLDRVEQMCVLGVRPPQPKQSRAQRLMHHHAQTSYEDITLALYVGTHYGDDAYLQNLARDVAQRNSRLPALKRVTRVIAMPERFEVSAGIKIKRIALKKQIEENRVAYREINLKRPAGSDTPGEVSAPVVTEAAAPTDLLMDEIKQKVRRIYAETLDTPESELHDDSHFIDELGGDSLQVLGMSLKIEEIFGVQIPPEDYGRCVSVNELSTLLYARMRGDEAYRSEADREDGEPVTPITRFEDTPEYLAFEERQHQLMHDGDNPYFVCHESPLTDVSLMDGHRVYNFGSYNYVCMSGRQEVMDAAKAAIDKYGTSASGSRLLAGEKALYQELERELAQFKHAEDALVLVGGHSTNVTFVGNFCGKRDLIVYDAIAHNSVAQGCRLSQATAKPFPHNDPEALDTILRLHRARYEKVLIIIEGAYSMDGDIADVPAFVALKKKYGCFLMVDEAHSACVIGQTGGGVDEYFSLEPGDVDIKMGTLSKGLGTCGGYLAGSRALIEYLRYNLPGFVFSVGISPPLAAATLESLRLLKRDPSIMERMRRNIRVFVEEAHKRNLNTCLAGETAVIPILVGRDEDAFLLSNLLRREGVFVPPAVYPAVPKNKARLRFCVVSEHKPEQIVEALDKLVAVAARAGIPLPETDPKAKRA